MEQRGLMLSICMRWPGQVNSSNTGQNYQLKPKRAVAIPCKAQPVPVLLPPIKLDLRPRLAVCDYDNAAGLAIYKL